MSVWRSSVLPAELQHMVRTNVRQGGAVPLREERKRGAPDMQPMPPAFGRQREIIREPPLLPGLPCMERRWEHI